MTRRLENSFSFLFSQLREGIQNGPPGLSVVSHVVKELKGVIDHAPIHHLHYAKDLLKRHELAPS